MTKLMSIEDVPKNIKVALIKELGYDSDGIFVLKNGKKHLDKYTEEPIKVDNMFVYPGSVIILDNNPYSISSFLEEFGDVL